VVLLLGFVKKMNREKQAHAKDRDNAARMENAREKTQRTAMEIIELLEPLVREAQAAGLSFEEQILEKKQLIKGLNDSLDAKTISLNLLLSRAESLTTPPNSKMTLGTSGTPVGSPDTMVEQQNRVVAMYDRGLDVDTIASKLSMPKGEVQLVIRLKEKLMKMESQT